MCDFREELKMTMIRRTLSMVLISDDDADDVDLIFNIFQFLSNRFREKVMVIIRVWFRRNKIDGVGFCCDRFVSLYFILFQKKEHTSNAV